MTTKTKTKTESNEKITGLTDIRFVVEKETRNTYRFAEVDGYGKPKAFGEGIIGTLYLKKSLFETPPKSVTVSVSFE